MQTVAKGCEQCSGPQAPESNENPSPHVTGVAHTKTLLKEANNQVLLGHWTGICFRAGQSGSSVLVVRIWDVGIPHEFIKAE